MSRRERRRGMNWRELSVAASFYVVLLAIVSVADPTVARWWGHVVHSAWFGKGSLIALSLTVTLGVLAWRRPTRPSAAGDSARARTPAAPAAPEELPRTIPQLVARFATVCESAVDSLEVACALEFEGINDAGAREHFAASDVFALADELYQQVPRNPAEPPRTPDPWTTSKLRPLQHGLLYALPAAFFPAAVALLAGHYVPAMLIVALLTAWTLGQTLAFLGYRRLTPTDTAAARRILRAGMVIGTVAASAVLGALCIWLGASAPVLWFGIGEAAYMLGASVLFVLGKERLVFAALAPGLVASTCYLILGRPHDLSMVTWALLATTPALAVALALVATSIPRVPLLAGFRRAELLAALPTAVFGITTASLLIYPSVAGLHGHGGINPAVLLATLPISLSMGLAEWSLLWFRRRTRRLLTSTNDPRRFARGARATFAVAVLQYAGMAFGLIAAAVVVAGATGIVDINSTYGPQLVAYLLLGVAMFLALSVQAVGLRTFTIVACACAFGFEMAFRGIGVPSQLIACGGLVVGIGWYALIQLGAVTRHSG